MKLYRFYVHFLSHYPDFLITSCSQGIIHSWMGDGHHWTFRQNFCCQTLWCFHSPFHSHISLSHLSLGLWCWRWLLSCSIPVIQMLKFLQVLLGQLETKFHLSSCEQMGNPHRTYTFHFEFYCQYSVYWHFEHVQEAHQYSIGQMPIIFNDESNNVGVDFSHQSSWPTTLWCIMNWLSTVVDFVMPLFNAQITRTFISKTLLC